MLTPAERFWIWNEIAYLELALAYRKLSLRFYRFLFRWFYR